MKERTRLLAYVLLLAVVLVWGSTFALVKAALGHTPPLMFNLVRMSLAFVVLAVVNARSLRGMTRVDVGFGVAAGLFLALGYQFQTAGLVFTTASKSAFLTGLVVVFVPLLSAIPGVSLPGAARPTFDTYAGALLAFAGLVLLTTPPGSGAAVLSGMHVGEWLSLLCAVAFATHPADALSRRSEGVRTAAGDAADRVCGDCHAGNVAAGWGDAVRVCADAVDRPRRDGAVSHRRRVYDPKLGAAAPSGIAHGADLYAGAGVCMADISAVLWRAAGSAGDGGSWADSGRDTDCGAAANLAAVGTPPTCCWRIIYAGRAKPRLYPCHWRCIKRLQVGT